MSAGNEEKVILSRNTVGSRNVATNPWKAYAMKGNTAKPLYKLSKKIGTLKFRPVVEGLWGIKMYLTLYALFPTRLLTNSLYASLNGGENKTNKVYAHRIYRVIV